MQISLKPNRALSQNIYQWATIFGGFSRISSLAQKTWLFVYRFRSSQCVLKCNIKPALNSISISLFFLWAYFISSMVTHAKNEQICCTISWTSPRQMLFLLGSCVCRQKCLHVSGNLEFVLLRKVNTHIGYGSWC